MLLDFVKKKIWTLLGFFTLAGIYGLLAYLYSIPMSGYIYGVFLCSFMGLIYGGISFFFYATKLKRIKELTYSIEYDYKKLPETFDIIEKEYQKMIEKLVKININNNSKTDSAITDMIDYYTLWVHQIKTPISAIRLLLETEEFPAKADMKLEVFKIEQYVEMVLQYLRLGSQQTDFLFRYLPLDNIIRDAVKKYSGVFIRKKLSLDYETIVTTVLTDEKWLSFVIEQILSNALKYTRKGGIKIYMEDSDRTILVIEDTGIGIREEDVPRVFDRGYTGYNGRTDKKINRDRTLSLQFYT